MSSSTSMPVIDPYTTVEITSSRMPPSTETGISVFLSAGIKYFSAPAISMLKSSVAMTMMNVHTFSSAKLIDSSQCNYS